MSCILNVGTFWGAIYADLEQLIWFMQDPELNERAGSILQPLGISSA